MKTPKESQRTPQINPKCTSPHPYHSIIWYSGVCFMDSTPRYVWVEKGGDSKRMSPSYGEPSTFTNPKHIIYIKEVFFLYLILSIKRHNTNSLLLDVLKVFYALDFDVLWCCGRLSCAKRRESSSRVLHYYVVVRCVCDWNSRPILLFVQLEEGKTLSKESLRTRV